MIQYWSRDGEVFYCVHATWRALGRREWNPRRTSTFIQPPVCFFFPPLERKPRQQNQNPTQSLSLHHRKITFFIITFLTITMSQKVHVHLNLSDEMWVHLFATTSCVSFFCFVVFFSINPSNVYCWTLCLSLGDLKRCLCVSPSDTQQRPVCVLRFGSLWHMDWHLAAAMPGAVIFFCVLFFFGPVPRQQ